MADAVVDVDEFPGEFLKAPVLGNLLPGVLEGAERDGALPEGLPDASLEEPGGAVAGIALAGAAAVGLAALAVAGEERAGTKIADAGELAADGVAVAKEGVEGVGGHGVASCLCQTYILSDIRPKAKSHQSRHKYVVHPGAPDSLTIPARSGNFRLPSGSARQASAGALPTIPIPAPDLS